MFEHSIFSLPFIFVAMVVSADGWFGFGLLFLGVFAAVSARNFAMGVNRYADREIDAKNPRTASRPNADGRVAAETILLFIAVNAFVFVAVAYMINSLAFALSVPILLVLASYSYFKRFSVLAHLVLGLSLGLAPIAGVIAVSGTVTPWSVLFIWVYSFGLLDLIFCIRFKTESLIRKRVCTPFLLAMV